MDSNTLRAFVYPLIFTGIVFVFLYNMKRSWIPEHLLGHTLIYQRDLIKEETAFQLRELMKEMKTFPSNIAADLKNQQEAQSQSSNGTDSGSNEDIGEGTPLLPDGSCKHPFLVPNLKRTKCVLPGRIDVGKHFILSGGCDGIRESYDQMIHRVTSFGRYNFFHDGFMDKHPVISDLFLDEKFLKLGRDVCPKDKQYLDPFQFNFIVQIPGQTVATHLDAPWYYGATRFDFPQWLLVAMTFSGLFQERFIDQVQVVAYLHEWQPTLQDRGDFVYYSQNSAEFETIGAEPRSGSGIDGSKSIHAARTYRPHVTPPSLDKDKDSALVYDDTTDVWDLKLDGEVIAKYNTTDLRTSIVYRARCFNSSEDAKAFDQKTYQNKYPDLTLKDVISTFAKDLIARGVLSVKNINEISKLDMALLIIDTYILYPLPPRDAHIIPWNYCALTRLYPRLEPLIKLFC